MSNNLTPWYITQLLPPVRPPQQTLNLCQEITILRTLLTHSRVDSTGDQEDIMECLPPFKDSQMFVGIVERRAILSENAP